MSHSIEVLDLSSLFLLGNPRLAEEQASNHDDEAILLLMLPLVSVDSPSNRIPYMESDDDEKDLAGVEDCGFHMFYSRELSGLSSRLAIGNNPHDSRDESADGTHHIEEAANKMENDGLAHSI